MTNHLDYSGRLTRCSSAITMALVMVLVGSFTGTSEAQSVLAAGPALQTAQPGCRRIDLNLNTVTYIPPRTRGDRDFKGNGPRYVVDIQHRALPYTLVLEIYMKAWEVDQYGAPKSDYTTVEGTYQEVLYTLPYGWEIRNMSVLHPGGMISQPFVSAFGQRIERRDRSHGNETVPPTSVFINSITVVGDTDGNEAGSRTGVIVSFNPASINICPEKQ